MATSKTYTVAGVSTHKSVTKVRFANDFVNRIKILQKNDHTDIELLELDSEMTKEDICKMLMDHPKFQNEAAQGAIAEYVTRNVKSEAPKAVKAPKAKAAPKAKTTTEVSVSEMEDALI
jgi:hypothetical protein